jgi:hypothetical protein
VRAIGADPELLLQALAVEEPEDRLGVAYVDRKEHSEIFDL